MVSQLETLLHQTGAQFHWDEDRLVWWLTGSNPRGDRWQSPTFQAGSREHAEEMAVSHIIAYNHLEEHGDVLD